MRQIHVAISPLRINCIPSSGSIVVSISIQVNYIWTICLVKFPLNAHIYHVQCWIMNKVNHLKLISIVQSTDWKLQILTIVFESLWQKSTNFRTKHHLNDLIGLLYIDNINIDTAWRHIRLTDNIFSSVDLMNVEFIKNLIIVTPNFIGAES